MDINHDDDDADIAVKELKGAVQQLVRNKEFVHDSLTSQKDHPPENLDDNIGIKGRQQHDQENPSVPKARLGIKISHRIREEERYYNDNQSCPQGDPKAIKIIGVREKAYVVGKGENHLHSFPRNTQPETVLEKNEKRNKEKDSDHQKWWCKEQYVCSPQKKTFNPCTHLRKILTPSGEKSTKTGSPIS